MALRAESDGDGGWRLYGEKRWISNAPEADVYTVFARTTPEAGSRGVTAFVVPGDRAGLSGEHLEMVSPHPIGSLTFDGVRVDGGEVLGEVDKGFTVAMSTLDLFRPSVGAFAVGMAQAAFEATRGHADTRQAFGAPLRAMQSVGHTLAEMAMRIEAARLLVYRAGAAYDAGRPGVSSTSAMAKLFATESAQWVVDARSIRSTGRARCSEAICWSTALSRGPGAADLRGGHPRCSARSSPATSTADRARRARNER